MSHRPKQKKKQSEFIRFGVWANKNTDTLYIFAFADISLREFFSAHHNSAIAFFYGTSNEQSFLLHYFVVHFFISNRYEKELANQEMSHKPLNIGPPQKMAPLNFVQIKKWNAVSVFLISFIFFYPQAATLIHYFAHLLRR